MQKYTIENHNGIYVLRDDLIEGGTKARFLPKILDPKKNEYVYASPAYGAFQIALAATARALGKKASIFTAKRKELHPYTKRAQELGAEIHLIPYGYLNVVQRRAQDYALIEEAQYLPFGADTPEAHEAIAEITKEVLKALGGVPDEIWVAIGSGTLAKGIHNGTEHLTKKPSIIGVEVGKELDKTDLPKRIKTYRYHKPFNKEADSAPPFTSTANYDAKAWEYAQQHHRGTTLFWNVL